MNLKKTLIAVGVCAGLGLTATSVSAVTLTFINNTNAVDDYTVGAGSGSFTGLPNSGNFAADSEFRVVTSSGTSLNDGPKDTFSGGETWTFDVSGNMTAGVSSSNTGASQQAPTTTGVTGYPLCPANSCDIIQNGADFLGAGLFTMAAPTLGDSLSTAVDPNNVAVGVTTIDTSGLSGTPVAGETFTVHFPVLYTQWADGTYVIGAGQAANVDGTIDWATAPGVTATGTMLNDDDFILRFSYQMLRGEVTVAGFKNNYVELEALGCFSGNCATAEVPVPAAVWLFGSGLIGLVGVARRKKANLN